MIIQAHVAEARVHGIGVRVRHPLYFLGHAVVGRDGSHGPAFVSARQCPRPGLRSRSSRRALRPRTAEAMLLTACRLSSRSARAACDRSTHCSTRTASNSACARAWRRRALTARSDRAVDAMGVSRLLLRDAGFQDVLQHRHMHTLDSCLRRQVLVQLLDKVLPLVLPTTGASSGRSACQAA